MSKLAALTTVVVLAGVCDAAHAEGYLAAGAQVGTDIGLSSDVGLDLGIPMHANAPLLHLGAVHGNFNNLDEAVGSTSDTAFYYGQGSFVQARAGVEGERCAGARGACFIYGADLGYLHTSASSGPWTDTPSARYTQYQVIPRIGLDFGGENLRVRLMLDIAGGKTTRTAAYMMETESRYGGQGTRVGAAIAYRF